MFHKNLRGRDLHSPSNELVENNTGSTISALKCVTITSLGTQYPQIAVANLTTIVYGLVQADIATGSTGYITCIGVMNNQNTSTWAPGTKLYCDSSGNLSNILIGLPIALVLKQDPVNGMLFVNTQGITQSDLTAATAIGSWVVGGNSVDSSAFLGTLNAQDLRIVVNSNQKAVFDQNGRLGIGIATPKRHFHQKSHIGNGSGFQRDTWRITTNTMVSTTVYVILIDDPSVVRFEFTAVARAQDGSSRASFKRTGFGYRESSNSQLQGNKWQSDYTIKSDNDYDVSYQLTPTSIILKVTSPTASSIDWTGSVVIEELAP